MLTEAGMRKNIKELIMVKEGCTIAKYLNCNVNIFDLPKDKFRFVLNGGKETSMFDTTGNLNSDIVFEPVEGVGNTLTAYGKDTTYLTEVLSELMREEKCMAYVAEDGKSKQMFVPKLSDTYKRYDVENTYTTILVGSHGNIVHIDRRYTFAAQIFGVVDGTQEEVSVDEIGKILYEYMAERYKTAVKVYSLTGMGNRSKELYHLIKKHIKEDRVVFLMSDIGHDVLYYSKAEDVNSSLIVNGVYSQRKLHWEGN